MRDLSSKITLGVDGGFFIKFVGILKGFFSVYPIIKLKFQNFYKAAKNSIKIWIFKIVELVF